MGHEAPSAGFPGSHTPRERRIWPAAALLGVLTFAAFAPAAHNGFTTLDDVQYIRENPQVRRGLTPQTALWALTTTENANWYPLQRLSHLVDVNLFGMQAGGHHLVSAAWHAAAAVLLFLALHLMTGAPWRSLAVAALFGVHPLQVESVAWAAERSNVLAGFCFALTLLLWARHARRPGPGRYAAALAACALGLAAKPILMTLPFLLLLLDVWPLGRVSRSAASPEKLAWSGLRRPLLEKVPMLALAAAAGGMALAAHSQVKGLASLESIPFGFRLGNAALSYWRYLGNLVWPARLAVYYPHPGTGLPVGAAALAGLLLAILTAVALAQTRRRPWLAVGWLWYLGALVPMIGLVQFGGHAMADRFVYLPSIGVFLAGVWQVAAWVCPRSSRMVLPGLATAALLAASTAATVSQVGLWKDDLVLYRHALEVTERNWLAHFALGNALMARGSQDEAARHFEVSVRINPSQAECWDNLGVYYASHGRFDEAELALRQAVRIKPDLAAARFNLGFRLLRRGDRAGAYEQYEALRRLDPSLAESFKPFLAVPR